MPRMTLQVESCALEPVEEALPASLRRRAIALVAEGASDARASGRCARRVGFIGLDRIGKAMALRLLKAGHQLMVYDPDQELPEALACVGATVALSIRDACRSADAVFTMLPDDEAAETVVLGPGGVVESLPGKAIHIGSSSVSVECSDRIVEGHWNAGKQYVSAPVLSRSESTAQEQLLLIAAGREAAIAQVEPLLRQIGQVAQFSGWPSDANLLQLGANGMNASVFQFLARHPELSARPDRSQLGRPASRVARLLDI